MKYEIAFNMNEETVKIDPINGTLDWHGFRQYTDIQALYSDLIEILLNHKIDGEDLVEFSSSSYFRLYLYNGKMYRVWFYSDGTMYIQHIDDNYDSIDDMMPDNTAHIIDVLNAIVNDN